MKYDRRFKRQNNFISIKLHDVINILHYICISQKLYIRHWKALCNFIDIYKGLKSGIAPSESGRVWSRIDKLIWEKAQKGDLMPDVQFLDLC